jgi:hypothetical protein
MAVPVHRTFLIAIVCAAILVVAGCGGGSTSSGAPSEGPGLFMSSLIRQKATGQYDVAWKSLHPSHQEVAPEKVYIRCENLTVFPGHLTKVSVVQVRNEPVLIAGEQKSVPSKAVTLKVAVNSPGIPKPVVVRDTYHAVAVDGHWTWLLTKDNFAEYKAGKCPGTDTPTTKA